MLALLVEVLRAQMLAPARGNNKAGRLKRFPDNYGPVQARRKRGSRLDPDQPIPAGIFG